MITIDVPARTIPAQEFFDNRTQEFITIEEKKIEPIHLQLEHSLMSIAKWESKWHKPFLGEEKLEGEELLDYIRCMTVNSQRNPDVYRYLPVDQVNLIVEYIGNPCSAWEIKTTPEKVRKKRKADPVEAIYYAMIQYGIPLECERWHFNRLHALLDYCDYKGGSTSGAGGPRKRTEKEINDLYRAINEKNRKKYNSKG